MPSLIALGWDDVRSGLFEQHRQQGLQPARVIAQHRGAFVLGAEEGEVWAEPSGRLRHDAVAEGLPVTGDWVAYHLPPGGGRAVVRAVLPRITAVTRKAAGLRTEAQVLAANVDVVAVAAAASVSRNDHRVERYLAAAWDSGGEPVLVLTKCDLAPASDLDRLTGVARGVDVLRTSAVTGDGIAELRSRLLPDRTAVLLGPSGVGKSSLINALVGSELQDVGDVRTADSRGRHTTTSRELVVLDTGGALIDTPGLRELALWDDEGLSRAYADIEDLGARCRFRDCSHKSEPGCAIRAALSSGDLDPDRWERHRKMLRELAHLEDRKGDEAKRRSKQIARANRARFRAR